MPSHHVPDNSNTELHVSFGGHNLPSIEGRIDQTAPRKSPPQPTTTTAARLRELWDKWSDSDPYKDHFNLIAVREDMRFWLVLAAFAKDPAATLRLEQVAFLCGVPAERMKASQTQFPLIHLRNFGLIELSSEGKNQPAGLKLTERKGRGFVGYLGSTARDGAPTRVEELLSTSRRDSLHYSQRFSTSNPFRQKVLRYLIARRQKWQASQAQEAPTLSRETHAPALWHVPGPVIARQDLLEALPYPEEHERTLDIFLLDLVKVGAIQGYYLPKDMGEDPKGRKYAAGSHFIITLSTDNNTRSSERTRSSRSKA